MKRVFLFSFFILSGYILASSLVIQDANAKGCPCKKMCKKDIKQYCKGLKEKDKFACLKQKKDEGKLSESCNQLFLKFEKLQNVCANDINSFCQKSNDNLKKLFGCLKKNKKKLSESCKIEIKNMKSKHMKQENSVAQEMQSQANNPIAK